MIEAHERNIPIEEMEQELADGRRKYVSSYQPAGYRAPTLLPAGQKLEGDLQTQAQDLARLRDQAKIKQARDGDDGEDKLVDV